MVECLREADPSVELRVDVIGVKIQIVRLTINLVWSSEETEIVGDRADIDYGNLTTVLLTRCQADGLITGAKSNGNVFAGNRCSGLRQT